MTTALTRARIVAFHLPQFHPVPENDEWWGKGFTEWTNVSQAKPQFPGHNQPRLPADLGYYDLRVPEVREKQAALARAYGVEAFCYWHYWFQGKRLLGRPVDEVLKSGRPDFPFCLAWANETWSRRWLGEEKDILIKQTYSRKDDLEHAKWLAQAFADRRYLRVSGRPLFLVYKPADLPEPRRTIKAIRAECRRRRLPNPYLLGISAHLESDWREVGFDGTLAFEPQLGVLAGFMKEGLKVGEYRVARQLMESRRRKWNYPVSPCIFVGWDNTPRRGADGIVFTDASPELFAKGLDEFVQSVRDKPFQERLVFVNAWNEWAEGNYLEPDQHRGRAYLEAVRRVNCGIETAGSEGLEAGKARTRGSRKKGFRP